jgi:hypothetical protein
MSRARVFSDCGPVCSYTKHLYLRTNWTLSNGINYYQLMYKTSKIKKNNNEILQNYYISRDSVVGIATTLRAGLSADRIPVGARFFVPVETGLL